MFTFLKRLKYFLLFFLPLLILILILALGSPTKPGDTRYGVTFSAKHARSLGLDWKKSYLAMLDELNVRRLRLVAYWDEAEATPGVFNWTDLDWQVNEAAKRGGTVILAVGGRLPRWPECHFPGWSVKLTKDEREAKILEYIKKTVERYRVNDAVIAWQVENEAFLSGFGECPKFDPDFLDKEIALVKTLDARPLVITDSGELSIWIPAARRANIFGTTMYRDTYSRWFKQYIHYPITPGFFNFKRRITGWFAHPQDWIVIELAAEPWGPVSYKEMTQEEKDRTMSLAKFKDMVEFSRLAGFKTFYLWGAEWWYWEREVKKQPAYWDYAKTLFSR